MVPRATSRGTRKRSQLCSGCKTEPRRPGQSFCRKCHAAYMVDWRARKRAEFEALKKQLRELSRAS